MKRPAFQFYPSDWMNEPGLRISSLDARGLWIDLMCIMHKGEPYGHLTVRLEGTDTPMPLDAAQIARIEGETPATITKLLAELKRNGVSSQTAAGVYYSRRMVRDEVARNARAECGKLGGNPALKKGGKDNPPDNHQSNHRDKSKPTPSSSSSSSSSPPGSSGAASRRGKYTADQVPMPPAVEALLATYYSGATEDRREDVRDQCRRLLMHETLVVPLLRDGVSRQVPVDCLGVDHLEAACQAVLERTPLKPDAAFVLVMAELATTFPEWRARALGGEAADG